MLLVVVILLLIILIGVVVYRTSKFGRNNVNCSDYSGNLPAFNDLTQEEQDNLFNRYLSEQNKPS